MPPSKPNAGQSLSDLWPHVAAEWHKYRNPDLGPDDVRPGSHRKVWWLCGDCGHEWEAVVKNRTSLGRGCPRCAVRRVSAALQATDFTSSLMALEPEVAATWHPTKNGDLTPGDVKPRSGRVVWWLGDCGHEWKSTIGNRTQGFGCAVCHGKQVQVGVNDLRSQDSRVANEWHPDLNGGISPEQVSVKSNRRVWWLCQRGHEWQTSINNRVGRGSDCPFCAGQRLIPGENDLATIRPDLIKEWHPHRNTGLSPKNLTAANKQRVWWLCQRGHEWKTSPGSRSRGSGCPACAKHGFNPGKDGWLYLASSETLEMQQIGITNDPDSRLSVHRRNGWEIVDIRGPMNGDLARGLERKALTALTKRGVRLGSRSDSVRFDGYTESWSRKDLSLVGLAELIKWVHEDD